MAWVEAAEPLRLVAFYGRGLARLSATAAISNGAYEHSRPWAAALHGHPESPDGIAWRSRLDDDGVALALFDRAAHKVRVAGRRGLLEPAAERYLRKCVERYQVALG